MRRLQNLMKSVGIAMRSHRLRRVCTKRARRCLRQNNIMRQPAVFKGISGYSDAAARAQESQYHQYEKGLELLAAGQYDEAIAAFKEISDYSDAATQVQESQYQKGATLLAAGQYDEAVATFIGIIGFRDSLNRAWSIRYQYLNQNKIVSGRYQTIGLKSDGTVVAVGTVDGGLDAWADIIAITAGYQHTVALKSDGTVVAVGDNQYGPMQCKWVEGYCRHFGRLFSHRRSEV